MSQAQGQRWHDKREIVDVAAGLFARGGNHATGTQALCEAVGLGKGALYYYVESRENLLFMIHERVMDYFLAEIGAIAERDVSAEERLRLLGEVQLSAVATYPDHVSVFLHEYRALTVLSASGASRRQFEGYLESVLQDGVDRGEFAAQRAARGARVARNVQLHLPVAGPRRQQVRRAGDRGAVP